MSNNKLEKQSKDYEEEETGRWRKKNHHDIKSNSGTSNGGRRGRRQLRKARERKKEREQKGYFQKHSLSFCHY